MVTSDFRDYDAAQAVALFAHLGDLTGADMFIPLHRTMRDDIRGVSIRHGRVVAYQFPDWKTAQANLEKMVDEFVTSERQSILADIDHAKTDLKIAQARLDGLNAAEASGALGDQEREILTRLAAGDQLIAATAEGVTWWRGVNDLGDRPDSAALDVLFRRGYVVGGETSFVWGPGSGPNQTKSDLRSVSLYCIVLTQSGRTALGQPAPDNQEET